MYQYIKHIIHITLLVTTITSCASSKSEVVKGPVTLADLESKLKDGPIFIGENHVQPFARQTIIKLIQSGHVKALFLEFPFQENDSATTDYLGSLPRIENLSERKLILQLVEGMENITEQAMNRKKNPARLKGLIEAALDNKNIPIYFHDAPIELGKGVLINGKYEPFKYAATDEGIKQRNIDSSKIIQKHTPGPGTVVLAGQYHLDPQIVGKNNTLQALLGYGDDRAFYLHELTEALK